MAHHPRRERRRLASASPVSCAGAVLWTSQAGRRGTSVRRNASPESPVSCPDALAAQLETGSRRDAPLRVLETIGPLPVHASVDSPKPRRQAAASVRGGATPRIPGRLSAAAECGEPTIPGSPGVTAARWARLSEPWRFGKRPGRLAATPDQLWKSSRASAKRASRPVAPTPRERQTGPLARRSGSP